MAFRLIGLIINVTSLLIAVHHIIIDIYKICKFGIKIVDGTNIISICKLRKTASLMCVHLFWRTSQTQIEEIPHENNGILGSLF